MPIDRTPQRPTPKLLVWGLVGGMILFTIILVIIFMQRQRG